MSTESLPKVCLETSKGNIIIELNSEKAPITVKNFLDYVKDGFYDGLVFHRVIKDFMIQGGGLDADMQQKKTKSTIKNEAQNGLKNKRGTVAMARTAVVDSATSQFFINTVDNMFLDNRGKRPDEFGYCVFAEVVEGMEVVDEIRQVKTGNLHGYGDVPLETVSIISAKLME